MKSLGKIERKQVGCQHVWKMCTTKWDWSLMALPWPSSSLAQELLFSVLFLLSFFSSLTSLLLFWNRILLHSLAWTLSIFLFQPPKCWDYMYVPLHWACFKKKKRPVNTYGDQDVMHSYPQPLYVHVCTLPQAFLSLRLISGQYCFCCHRRENMPYWSLRARLD